MKKAITAWSSVTPEQKEVFLIENPKADFRFKGWKERLLSSLSQSEALSNLLAPPPPQEVWEGEISQETIAACLKWYAARGEEPPLGQKKKCKHVYVHLHHTQEEHLRMLFSDIAQW